MSDIATKEDHFKLRLSSYAVAGASIVYLPLLLPSPDSAAILSLLIAVPVVTAVLLFLSFRRRGPQRYLLFSLTGLIWLFSATLMMHFSKVRDASRWFAFSKTYKASVLAQPNQPDGELKHVEWTGWGFPGAGNTVVYLVFDPNDLLAAEVRSHSDGSFSGIPCKVFRVQRLESHWYTVHFYTDTEWRECDAAGEQISPVTTWLGSNGLLPLPSAKCKFSYDKAT